MAYYKLFGIIDRHFIIMIIDIPFCYFPNLPKAKSNFQNVAYHKNSKQIHTVLKNKLFF